MRSGYAPVPSYVLRGVFQWVRARAADTKTCPECRVEFSSRAVRRAPRTLERVMDHLTLKCAFEGCAFKGSISSMVEHERNCNCKPTICIWGSCGQSLRLGELRDHMLEHLDSCITCGGEGNCSHSDGQGRTRIRSPFWPYSCVRGHRN